MDIMIAEINSIYAVDCIDKFKWIRSTHGLTNGYLDFDMDRTRAIKAVLDQWCLMKYMDRSIKEYNRLLWERKTIIRVMKNSMKNAIRTDIEECVNSIFICDIAAIILTFMYRRRYRIKI